MCTHIDTRRVIQSDVKGLLSAPSIKSIIFVSPLPLADGSIPRPHHRENTRANRWNDWEQSLNGSTILR